MDMRNDMKINLYNACRVFQNGTAKTAIYIAIDAIGLATLWTVHSTNGQIKSVYRYVYDNANDFCLDMVELGYSLESIRKFYDNFVKYAFLLHDYAVANSHGCSEENISGEWVLILSNGTLHADNVDKEETSAKDPIWGD